MDSMNRLAFWNVKAIDADRVLTGAYYHVMETDIFGYWLDESAYTFGEDDQSASLESTRQIAEEVVLKTNFDEIELRFAQVLSRELGVQVELEPF